MKIYISGHTQNEARKIAKMLEDEGHEITSSWINADWEKEGQLDDKGKSNVAEMDIAEVLASDALLMFSSPRRVPGGKFVECGVALGSGKQVILIGHRENMLMYYRRIRQYNSVDDFLKNP